MLSRDVDFLDPSVFIGDRVCSFARGRVMFPRTASEHLKRASFAANPPPGRFTCSIFSPEWNAFVETWAPRCYAFVEEALGPYQTEPLPDIALLPDGFHAAGANASFATNGQIALSTVIEGKPGMTLEKLTHELTHASLAAFPEGDPYYEEGGVDYAVWVMAHAPFWGEHQQAMLESAARNIATRRDRAFQTGTDYDRKRWSGGLYASIAYGPHIIARLRQKKLDGDLTW